MAKQTARDQQCEDACAGDSDDHDEDRSAGVEGDRTGNGADRSSGHDGWGAHPVPRCESGVGAQRRRGADTGETVAREALEPTEEADDEQRRRHDDQRCTEHR
jgi:hypothetical protein